MDVSYFWMLGPWQKLFRTMWSGCGGVDGGSNWCLIWICKQTEPKKKKKKMMCRWQSGDHTYVPSTTLLTRGHPMAVGRNSIVHPCASQAGEARKGGQSNTGCTRKPRLPLAGWHFLQVFIKEAKGSWSMCTQRAVGSANGSSWRWE